MTQAAAIQAEPAGAARGASLKRRALEGSAWTTAGFGIAQVLRLGSNVLLAAVLTPAAFGLMGLVNVVLTGLEMFSDVGIGPSIIQSKRGEDPSYLRTAWTIQVVRGVVLAAAAVGLAWPMAAVSGAPGLFWPLVVCGLVVLAAGFNSTAIFTLNRRLAMGRLTVLDLASQVFSIGVMLGWAYFISASVWALVAGSVLGMGFRAAASHVVLPGVRHGLAWDRSAARELFTFGRWIVVSTAISYLAYRAYPLIVNFQMGDIELFGVFMIALLFPSAVEQLTSRMTRVILFPVYADLGRRDAARLRPAVRRVQLVLMLVVLPPLLAMVVLGPQIVALLYSAGYAKAGWMMQVLAAGAIFGTLGAARAPVLLAMGNSRRHMIVQATHGVFLLGGMLAGGAVLGIAGVLMGIAAAPLLNYPVLAWATRRYGVWLPWLDASALAACAGLALAGLYVFGAI